MICHVTWRSSGWGLRASIVQFGTLPTRALPTKNIYFGVVVQRKINKYKNKYYLEINKTENPEKIIQYK